MKLTMIFNVKRVIEIDDEVVNNLCNQKDPEELIRELVENIKIRPAEYLKHPLANNETEIIAFDNYEIKK